MAKKIEVWRHNGNPGSLNISDARMPTMTPQTEESDESGLVIDAGTPDNNETSKYYENFLQLMKLRALVYDRLNWWPDNLFLPTKIQRSFPSEMIEQREKVKRHALQENTKNNRKNGSHLNDQESVSANNGNNNNKGNFHNHNLINFNNGSSNGYDPKAHRYDYGPAHVTSGVQREPQQVPGNRNSMATPRGNPAKEKIKQKLNFA